MAANAGGLKRADGACPYEAPTQKYWREVGGLLESGVVGLSVGGGDEGVVKYCVPGISRNLEFDCLSPKASFYGRN